MKDLVEAIDAWIVIWHGLPKESNGTANEKVDVMDEMNHRFET